MQGVSVLMAQAGMWLHCDPSMRPAGANEQVLPPLVCAHTSKAISMAEAPATTTSYCSTQGVCRAGACV